MGKLPVCRQEEIIYYNLLLRTMIYETSRFFYYRKQFYSAQLK